MDAIIGFNKNLLKSNDIFKFFFNDIKHIIKDTKCDSIDYIIAPFTPNIGINNILNTSFITAPIANATTGVLTFPNP